MVAKPHSGHLDAELDRPEELTDERLTAIIHECLQRWEGFPTIPGSRRWSVNGKTALRELSRRRSNLEEQLEAMKQRVDWSAGRETELREQLEERTDALQAIYWNGCSGFVEEMIIDVLPPEERAAWKAQNPASRRDG